MFSVAVAHAEVSANISTTLTPVLNEVVYPIIYFIFTLAIFIFVWGVAEMIWKGTDGTARETGRKHILYGVIGIFIMVSAWGIVKFISSTLSAVKSEANSEGNIAPTNLDWNQE